MNPPKKVKAKIHLDKYNQVILRYSARYDGANDSNYSCYFVNHWDENGIWQRMEDDVELDPSQRIIPVDGEETIPDALNLGQLTYRVRFVFRARVILNWTTFQTEEVFLTKVMQGDEPKISKLGLKAYFSRIKEILIENFQKMRKMEVQIKKRHTDYIPFRSLIFEGTVTPQSTLIYTLKPSQQYFKLVRNQKIIVID